MAWGAVLGILVGVMFALYGLPPILRSIYGPTTVEHAETYEGDAKSIVVTGVTRDGDDYLVELQASTNSTWNIAASDWQLEVDGNDDWIPAEEPSSSEPGTDLDFELGEERTLLLRFSPDGDGEAGEARVLHLDDPRLRFELQAPGDD